MFCILITAMHVAFFVPRCVGFYDTFALCNEAVVEVALSVDPRAHQGYAFKCVEQGSKS